MSQSLSILLSAIAVFILVAAIGRKFKISSRYDRGPRELNPWSALDKGIDPTEKNE
jgi:hypothetical protein